MAMTLSQRAVCSMTATDYSGVHDDQELVDLWLATRRSENTKRAYAEDVNRWLQYLNGQKIGLQSATAKDVEEWFSSVEGSAATRARRISSVRSLMTFGCKVGYLVSNVSLVVPVPVRQDNIGERILTEAQVKKLIRVAKGRNRAFVLLLYSSGARLSEITSLKWKQIRRLPNGAASISLHGKGDKTRHVHLSPDVVSVLDSLRAPGGSLDDYVFLTNRKTPLSRANARRIFRQLSELAGLDFFVSPVWMRHAHATHALDNGAPIHLVQATLGHANIATTGRYLHANPEESSSSYLKLE